MVEKEMFKKDGQDYVKLRVRVNDNKYGIIAKSDGIKQAAYALQQDVIHPLLMGRKPSEKCRIQEGEQYPNISLTGVGISYETEDKKKNVTKIEDNDGYEKLVSFKNLFEEFYKD